ncbi:MAG TPA: GGDEF domain-containing protein [Streptosporangiaceae bacterium]
MAIKALASRGPEFTRACLSAVRTWPLWALAPALRAYVITISLTATLAIAAAAALTPWHAQDAETFAILLAIGAITVESVRRAGEPALAGKDAHGIWQLAIAILLPPFYALTAPVMVLALTQWRVRRTIAHRRVFSAAAVGLSYGAASVVFHLCWHPPRGPHPSFGRMLALWVLLAAGCAVLRWLLNYALVVTAIRLTDRAAHIRNLVGGASATFYHDAAELVIGILIAYCATTSKLVLVFLLPWAILLERSVRATQLEHASRTDPQTGLLSAPAWQHEAAVQVSRARQSRTALAVAMIDIDQLTRVDDAYGRQARDAVLLAVAGTLVASTRKYDLTSRLGGEEFTLLLPHADPAEALDIAERLKSNLSQITVPADFVPPAADDPPPITACIGLANLTETTTDLTDLLTAADSALHRAKRAGRNTIRLAGLPPPAVSLFLPYGSSPIPSARPTPVSRPAFHPWAHRFITTGRARGSTPGLTRRSPPPGENQLHERKKCSDSQRTA